MNASMVKLTLSAVVCSPKAGRQVAPRPTPTQPGGGIRRQRDMAARSSQHRACDVPGWRRLARERRGLDRRTWSVSMWTMGGNAPTSPLCSLRRMKAVCWRVGGATSEGSSANAGGGGTGGLRPGHVLAVVLVVVSVIASSSSSMNLNKRR